MNLSDFLTLSATLALSIVVVWFLIKPFFEGVSTQLKEQTDAALSADLDSTGESDERRNQLLEELEELEQLWKGGMVDELTYGEQRKMLLSELAPYYTAQLDRPSLS